MRKFLILAFILGPALGCQENEALRSDLTSATRQILRTAARGDSAATATLVEDSVALSRVRLLAEEEPAIVESLVNDRVHVEELWARGDTAGASFRVRSSEGIETLQMTFIQADGAWRLLYLTLPDRG
jgi:hypothetical protein